MKIVLKIRIFLWLFLAAAVGWLLYMAVVPSGNIAYYYAPDKPSYFIKKMTPAERVKITGGGRQIIIGEPVYFSLFTPRRFDKAKLTIRYKTEGDAPVIEAGVLTDKKIWRYDLKPIANKIIDDLFLKWGVIKTNGLVLLQREKKFERLGDFLNNLPPREEIALYHYDLKADYFLKDYKKGGPEAVINYPLRGAYQFYTYIKDEDLNFKFVFFDLNKNKDSDPVELNLYQGSKFIAGRYFNDDGVSVDSGKESEDREAGLKMANLAEGVYKIELKANDDIVTKKIIVSQQKLAFINKIWLADAGGKDMVLFTDCLSLNAQTVNPAKLQTISAGKSALAVSETYKQFSAKFESGMKEIKLEKDDVILSGDGVFGFNEGNMINPEFRKVDASFNPEKEKINYVLAKYNPPAEEGDWRAAEVEFNLSGAYRENGKYSFIISIPGLRAENPSASSAPEGGQAGQAVKGVEIGEIKIKLEGKGLWEKLRDLRFKI